MTFFKSISLPALYLFFSRTQNKGTIEFVNVFENSTERLELVLELRTADGTSISETATTLSLLCMGAYLVLFKIQAFKSLGAALFTSSGIGNSFSSISRFLRRTETQLQIKCSVVSSSS